MKKIIVSACAVMAISLASVFANADDTAATPPSDSMTSPSSAVDSATHKTTTDTTTETMSKSKTPKTCTDSDGVIYKKGKKGFDDCLAQMKKAQKKDQMSGVTGSDSTDTHSMAPDSNTSSSGSTDTSTNR